MSSPVKGRLQAIVVAVGDELLYGATIDTNGAWLGARLADLGIPVLERRVVGDDETEIGSAVAEALRRADLVIVSGGLGPTPDDRTREAVAAQLGLEVHVDPELVAMLERRFRAFGHTSLPENNLKQATVPDGALVLANPRGSAPGLLLSVPGNEAQRVALFPGVPREMKGLFDEELVPELRRVYEDRLTSVFHRWIRTSGVAESVLSERLQPVLPDNLDGVSLAFLPRLTGVDLRLTVRDEPDAARAAAALDRVEAMVQPVVASFRYASDSGDIVEAIAHRLGQSGLSLAVAESCTGGLVAARITGLSGVSSFFKGGVVAYSNEVKTQELGVDPGLIADHGAVSEEVVLAMTRGVMARLSSETAIAITGIAGPGGGTEDKPVGTVWYAAAVQDKLRAVHRRFAGDREAVRVRSAQAALVLLHQMLAEDPLP